jgi:lysine 2,3-aminomutase
MSPSRTLRDPASLVAAGLAASDARPALEAVAARYAVAVTPALAALIEAPDDPIGRQFLPDPAELLTAPHERADPIGDDALSPVKGIVHRYPDRALLKPLLACPVYCRFCFRREHVGPEGGLLTEAELEAAYAWLAARPAIREVILTGGDPLMLSPRRLGAILGRLAAIPHVETLRIHTRVPVADPEAVTEPLVAAMDTAVPLWLVLHANHARELAPAAMAALDRLRRAGIPLLGQSVLLRGVNDSAAALEALFRAMLAARVKPYYLHQLDSAPGTARFHVPIAEGRRLLAALRGRVTGLAWPTYVLDLPGGAGKVPIGPEYLGADGTVRDPWGGVAHLDQPADREESTANGSAGD